MELLDGEKLAQKILDGLKMEMEQSSKKLRLAVIVLGEDPATQKFIAKKRKIAKYLGIGFRLYPFPESITTNELRKKIAAITHLKKNTGVIIQLPLPENLNTPYILNSVIPEKDVDMLSARSIGKFASGKSVIFPPVAGAVRALFEEYKIDYKNKEIVIVGAGGLVGKPISLWLLNEKTGFKMIESGTRNPEEYMRRADILISGIGRPGYIKGEWLKKGAVVVDAGTSEAGGKVKGDIDFASVGHIASYVAPVPGGVGPLTVAMLFRNLWILSRAR